MFYNNIIFQVKVNEHYYWGKFKINLIDYGIFQYKNQDLLMINYMKKWFDLSYSQLKKTDSDCKIIILVNKKKIDSIDELHFDIIFDQELAYIKIEDFEMDSTIYTKYYKQIHSQMDIDLELDYDTDELEYTVNEDHTRNKVEEAFNKYLDEEYEIKKEYEEEIKQIEEKYNDCLEGALIKLYEEEQINKFDYMKEESFANCKITDVNKKLEILEYLIENFSDTNKSLHAYCLKKYATQLCRKFKYIDNNLTKIRYNFVVTSFTQDNEHEHAEIKINFESKTSKVTGSGTYVEGGNNKRGTYSKIWCEIENKNDNYEFENETEEELIDYITDKMRYIKKN